MGYHTQQFEKKVEEMKDNNYELKRVKVNFIVYWLKEETEKEIKVILPEVYFERGVKKVLFLYFLLPHPLLNAILPVFSSRISQGKSESKTTGFSI
jgi:hypothetical protein